ncbi:MAG: hypothetical protein LBS97_05330 [Treponema sp.]|jgi:hypothetical protein|nr:hypothetical protein [Treponema sp.]
MKKLIAAVLVLALAVGTAFAQISLSGSGSAAIMALGAHFGDDAEYTDPDAVMAVEDPGRDGILNVQFTVSGVSQYLGFDVTVKAGTPGYNVQEDNAVVPIAKSVRLGDEAGIWVKPLDWLKLSVGKVHEDILTGKIGGSDLAYYILTKTGDRSKGLTPYHRIDLTDTENNIFSRFNPWPGGKSVGDPDYYGTSTKGYAEIAGAILSLTPVENLFVGAYLNPGYSEWEYAGRNVKNVFEEIQAGAGYEIPDVGLARLQYVGYLSQLEAAFAFTGLEGLVFDLGLKIPVAEYTPYENMNKDTESATHVKNDVWISAGASFSSGDFDLLANVNAKFGGYYYTGLTDANKTEGGFNLVAYVAPSYYLGFMTLGADIGFEYLGKAKAGGTEIDKSDGIDLGLGLWGLHTYGNGSLKYGLTAKLPTEWAGIKQDTRLYIPVILSYNF